MTAFLQRMGAAVCHQMAERSFIQNGVQMPLCARCTGIYLGVLLAFGFLFLKKRMQGNRLFSRKESLLTAGAILPLAVDGFCSYIGLWESNQLLRILTGSLAGAAVPGFLLLAVNVNPQKENTLPIYGTERELLCLLLGSAAVGLCLWAGLPVQGMGAVGSIIGEILLWGGFVWLVLKNLIPHRKMPYWRISLLIAGMGLFLLGGVLS